MDGRTLASIAAELGVSRERIRQIEAEALRSLAARLGTTIEEVRGALAVLSDLDVPETRPLPRFFYSPDAARAGKRRAGRPGFDKEMPWNR